MGYYLCAIAGFVVGFMTLVVGIYCNTDGMRSALDKIDEKKKELKK